MMCSALSTNNGSRDRSVVNTGGGKGNHECLRPVVSDIPISLCALHLLLAAQTVEELGGARELIGMVRRGE
ncbi:hypothetical protein SAMN06295974_0338 [Plantibacter flavus]|uniref:Uncharacterized protein n=1 Tax=Plantibacter flavus TaxID=150123 RepID=A0A3N2C1D0_9MICO|nr:hypothetical protein EDD42_1165 [Plantibacter flavus]SMG07989.1 hypothetical protein SAMN06295974_0338 [Plantibacter flavus]